MKSRLGTLTSWRKTLPIWVCVSLIAALVSMSTAGEWVEKTVDREWLFKLRDIRSEPKGVVIVSMDERAPDLPAVTRSDRLWSRALYAKLINRLLASGAAVIVLDVTFEDIQNETSDSALEQSLAKQCPNLGTVEIHDKGEVVAFPHFGGLHHEYRRAA